MKRGKKYEIISLNLRYGGQSRTDSILNYIKNQNPDILVLGEYKDDDNGQKIKTTLQQEGFDFEESEDDVLGVLVASKHPFTIIDKNPRWVEIKLKEDDLKVLGVYVPTGSGDKEFKDTVWEKILNYARVNREKNCIITGDFNSCCKEDTMNKIYSEKELTELKSLNWIDSWANFKADDSERYTWFSSVGNGFRLDYAFLSPKLSEQIEIIDIFMILK